MSYVLALSWSPTYCRDRDDPDQCGPRKYGFVAHGLWPQGIERCAAPGKLDEALIGAMLPIMPSRKLVAHQWAKHGTCDGSGAQAYFARTRQAFEAVAVPKPLQDPAGPVGMTARQVRQAFVQDNPGLPEAAVQVTCRGRFASEVRFCLDRDLKYAACPGTVGRDRCKGELVFPPIR